MTEIDQLRENLETMQIPYRLEHRALDLTGFYCIQIGNSQFRFHERTGKFIGVFCDEMDRPRFFARNSTQPMVANL